MPIYPSAAQHPPRSRVRKKKQLDTTKPRLASLQVENMPLPDILHVSSGNVHHTEAVIKKCLGPLFKRDRGTAHAFLYNVEMSEVTAERNNSEFLRALSQHTHTHTCFLFLRLTSVSPKYLPCDLREQKVTMAEKGTHSFVCY